MRNLIHGKYFYHVVISIILIFTIYIIWNKKSKDNQFELLMKEIGNVSTSGGGYADLGKAGSPFDANMYVPHKTLVTPLNPSESVILDTIWNKGSSTFNPLDNEQAVIDLFKKFNNKRQVSYISWSFYNKYKKDLYTYLDSFMANQHVTGSGHLGSTNYMVQLKNIVNGLPA